MRKQIITKDFRERMRILNTGRKVSEETREKLRKIMKEKVRTGKLKPYLISPFYQNRKSPMEGKTMTKEHKRKIGLANSKILTGRKSPKKGKTYEEINGKERAEEIKRKIGIKSIGRIPWNKGLKGYTNSGTITKEKRKYLILPHKDTSIEFKLQNFLKELNIEFYPHQYRNEIKHSYQCDIFVPSMNLIIEADGDYWHNFPFGNEIDHIRTKELIEKGFKVLRIWEHEIRKMDLISFKEKIGEIII